MSGFRRMLLVGGDLIAKSAYILNISLITATGSNKAAAAEISLDASTEACRTTLSELTFFRF